MDSTSVGLAYHMFSKSNSDDQVYAGVYGKALFPAGTNSTSSSAIGNEADLWAEHKYEGGLSMMANLGMFMPGATLKDSTPVTGPNKSSTVTQLTVAGKLTF